MPSDQVQRHRGELAVGGVDLLDDRLDPPGFEHLLEPEGHRGEQGAATDGPPPRPRDAPRNLPPDRNPVDRSPRVCRIHGILPTGRGQDLPVQIAIALFPRVTVLDAIGPYEVLQRLPDATVTFVGDQTGEVRADNGFLGLTVDATFADVPEPDVVVVPGGIGTRALLEPGSAILDWVRSAHETSRFTTSVCTGALVLGAAGLLDGLGATTHWAAYDELPGDRRLRFPVFAGSATAYAAVLVAVTATGSG